MKSDNPGRDSAFLLFAVVLVATFASMIGWQYGRSTAPQAVNTHTVEEVTPPACLRALAIADRELALAAELALTMSQVAPLVDDAYQAGLDGDTDPAVIDKVKRVNDRIREQWKPLGTLPNTRAKIAANCKDA